MGYKINERSDHIIQTSEEKYLARLDGLKPTTYISEQDYNHCRNQPKEAIDYLNLTTSQCKKYKHLGFRRLTPYHAKNIHGIKCLTIEEILGKISELNQPKRNQAGKWKKVNKTPIKLQIKELYLDEMRKSNPLVTWRT